MTPSRTIRFLAIFLVLASTVGCDQATKHFARTQLNQPGSTTAGRFVEFILAENPGAFLSFGASLPEATRGGLLTVGVSLGLSVLLAFLMHDSRLRWLSFLGLALVWAGGMSNLIDRFVRHGLVTDFILLRAGPFHTGIFNLADVSIVIGLLILAGSFHKYSARNST
jgi:signal peptidase II